jgi:RNA polymerase sigma-70 factor (ECF subfamily)
MSPADPRSNSDLAGAGRFATTHWSVVLAARDPAAPQARAALAALCQAYWYPLYAFIRRQGHPADQAQDLTQGFFTRLLEKNGLAAVDQARGRFRSFLLAACKHFLANERDRARARKRGGGRHFISIDFHDADSRYGREPAHAETAERLFERRWALALLDQVLARLRGEYEAGGKGRLFERLKGHLTGDAGGLSHAQAATELGLSEGAVKVAVHRLRQRYRALLRAEIGQTLDDPARIDEEIAALFATFGR